MRANIHRFLVAFAFFTPMSWSVDNIADNNLASRANDIVEKRCMVCHGCYDAPCQLKLEARAGLERGATSQVVYNAGRLTNAPMTRLFDDGLNEQQWRDKGFYPVLNNDDPQKGVLRRMLELKQSHPLSASEPFPEGFDFSLEREQQCPKEKEFDKYARDYPLWGMPYGLPGLSPDEHQTIIGWLDQGAPAPAETPLSPAVQAEVKRWDNFLNGTSNKEKLMARYLYEHLFLANLYFEDTERPALFRLVRSYTKPGRNIGLMATRRPFDPPKSKGFYYRLQRMPITPLMKIHMPYQLGSARMSRYRELFLEADYDVDQLPGYAAGVASNPFKVFGAIPIKSRYEFLLDEAQFSLMNFIKGPVCRGRVALSVITDHFWVMFVDPDTIDPINDAQFLAREADNLGIPIVKSGTPIDLLAWKVYAKKERRYQESRAKFLLAKVEENRKATLDSLWTGDGQNDNAALTIFRHHDSASVVKGFVGNTPRTAWVIDYPLLERIHYLLVANYDVYGPVSHQLESRMYMDFLRMEGELNFLLFMPEDKRLQLGQHWYRDAPKWTSEHFTETTLSSLRESGVEFETDDPKTELLQTMRKRIHGAQAPTWDYQMDADPGVSDALKDIATRVGAHNSYLPQISYLNVIGPDTDEVYTLVKNASHSNIALLFGEDKRRLLEEDTVTVVKGFLGAYPNRFFQVQVKDMPSFAQEVANIDSLEHYLQFQSRYAVQRNDPSFWPLSDKFHEMVFDRYPVRGGLLDYSRYHAPGISDDEMAQ
jgi:hypothetical protein